MKNHYFDFSYDLERKGWFAYYYQLKEVWKLIQIFDNPKVLEIGIGNSTVSDYLKKRDIDITTFDIDPELNPDIVGDIRDYTLDTYDIIICAEVLEHLPFNDFDPILKKISESAKYAVITLPQPHDMKKKSDEHYWEIGIKGYEEGKILKIISQHYNIEKSYRTPLWPYHKMLVLKNDL